MSTRMRPWWVLTEYGNVMFDGSPQGRRNRRLVGDLMHPGGTRMANATRLLRPYFVPKSITVLETSLGPNPYFAAWQRSLGTRTPHAAGADTPSDKPTSGRQGLEGPKEER